MRYFIGCQGYDIDKYNIFQHNMSALSLEKNGRVLSSKQTNHIKVKYFLIKDYDDAGEDYVKFCPTDGMRPDVLTKPLQGQKFRDICAFLQNCPRNYGNNTEQINLMNPQDVASLRECVGENAKNTRENGRQNKSPCCVLLAGETQALVKRQDRGPLPVMQTCHLKVSKSKTTWPNPMDKRYKRHKKMLTWPKDMQGMRVRATK
jgi:hypothetical protein